MRGRLPRTGSYTGDGSSDNVIDIGFRPRHVIIWDYTLGTVKAEIFDQPDFSSAAMKIVDGGAATNVSKISSNPPLITERGFTSGTDSDLITNSSVFYYVAF